MWIQEFLKTYNDEYLGRLLQAAHNNGVHYPDSSCCLLGRHQLGYTFAKNKHNPIASMAEVQYRDMYTFGKGLIPLIQAEMERRRPAPEPISVPIVEEVHEEELVCV